VEEREEKRKRRGWLRPAFSLGNESHLSVTRFDSFTLS